MALANSEREKRVRANPAKTTAVREERKRWVGEAEEAASGSEEGAGVAREPRRRGKRRKKPKAIGSQGKAKTKRRRRARRRKAAAWKGRAERRLGVPRRRRASESQERRPAKSEARTMAVRRGERA